ncbi:aspartic peptidase domain-containing protein [Boeremia exigua]|uniref:aspartic peptidase domain-containing protein n=1 Tax=Boeremia exigua TaxID=749465 RepID=UPI001E8E06EC|nr:aspartic peptidase domain-containing protein [Boeremia exigua]KAH6642246.1 aspartic peptidase domain-containing protein [Boeremia exigua]
MSKATKPPVPLAVQNSGRWLGNDGSWSTFFVHAGTPPQQFHVLPSFDGQTIYLPIDEDCLPSGFNISNCGASRGVEVFESKPGVGFQRNASSTWDEIGIYKVNMGHKYGLAGNAYFGYDTVGPSTSNAVDVPNLEKQSLGTYSSADYWQGRLGLSLFSMNFTDTDRPHSFLSRLKEEGHIPSLSFGYQVGAPYRQTGVAGSLILGGYDRSRRSDNTLSLSSSQDLLVGVQGISSQYSNGTTTVLLEEGFIAVVDSNVPELWLPSVTCDRIAALFNLTYNEETDRYLQSDVTRRLLQDHKSILSFTLGLSVSGGQTIQIEIPLPAFDHQVSYPIFASPTNYFPLRRAANDSQITLGRTFLQEVYISSDWERDEFNLSQAVFSAPMPKPDIVAIPPKNDDTLIETSNKGSKKPSTALLGGAIGGAIAAVLLLGCLVWYLCQRRRHRAKTQLPVEPMARPVDEKAEYSYFAPTVGEKSYAMVHMDAELDGGPIGERPAMCELGGGSVAREKVPHRAEAMELDGVEQVFELPSQTVER